MIKNILLLDSEGKRVAVKYYTDDWPTNSSKLAFEKFIFAKTLKTNARLEGMLLECTNSIALLITRVNYVLCSSMLNLLCFILRVTYSNIN